MDTLTRSTSVNDKHQHNDEQWCEQDKFRRDTSTVTFHREASVLKRSRGSMTVLRTELGKNGMMRGTNASTVIAMVSVFTATIAADVDCPPASITKFSAAR